MIPNPQRSEPMEAAEDDELQLLRISEGLVADLQKVLRRVLWKKSQSGKTDELKVHRIVKQRDLEKLTQKIEPFQQEPQLLDVQLKNVVPQVVTAYLESRGKPPVATLQPGHVTIQYAVCKILYTLCKVRGEKVIVGFFNNEPRFLEPLLSDFERGSLEANNTDAEAVPSSLSWEGRYILLLWLSHLMLSPFDLATMSSVDSGQTSSFDKRLKLPIDTPGIALRVIPICSRYLEAATRERNAASQLLVRLCLRPDMRKIGLLDEVAQWAINNFQNSDHEIEIHKSLGVLTFLSGLVASGNQREIGHFLAPIFEATQRLAAEEIDSTIRSSAVARKLFVKIFRNIVILCLQAPLDGIDTTSIVEDVIGLLLDTLADGDTPVRFAASKALSMVTLKLDATMAAEVVEAILGCLNEDILWEGSKRNLNAVNPLRWHGLTLTLSHLLYRRAVPTDQLPEILNALLLGLTFEQRSATGAAIGTNVRDAANFGIWAIARRYTTEELQRVDLASIRAIKKSKYKVTITQMLAIELIQSACLDPAGNIRRGSSAVLQELVGRHPDTVIEGIALIQVVDFHAVGLRQRAMSEVAFAVARFSPIYWDALFEALLGWRGIGALDVVSRIATARAIGALSASQKSGQVWEMVNTICAMLKQLASRQIEERHGLILSLADIVIQEQDRNDESRLQAFPDTRLVCRKHDDPPDRSFDELYRLNALWSVFDKNVSWSENNLKSPSLRPELTSTSTLRLFGALSTLPRESCSLPNPGDFVELFDLCLGRGEHSVLEEVPRSVIAFVTLLGSNQLNRIIETWLSFLVPGSRISHTRSAGRVLALGAALGHFEEQLTSPSRILNTLIARCTTEASVEERVMALRSLNLVVVGVLKRQPRDIPSLRSSEKPPMFKIAEAVLIGLNDYTISDRGDVGSLVRLEALSVVREAQISNTLFGWHEEVTGKTSSESAGIDVLSRRIRNAVLRLSLERLDKVRARSAQLIGCKVIDLSSYEYFRSVLDNVHHRPFFSPGHVDQVAMKETMQSVNEGYCSSAGMGSESIIQAARTALYDFLDSLDIERESRDDNLRAPTLFEVCDSFCDVVRNSLDNDRVLLPVLEVIAFLLDAGMFQRLLKQQFKFRNLLSLIQKSHFKSNNIQKLHTVLNIYRGLAEIPSIRPDVIKKVGSMLLHPFPSIRIAAAETLFVTSGIHELKPLDWSQSTKVLKEHVDRMKQEGIL